MSFEMRGLREFIFVFLALVLLLPILTACGGNGDESPTVANAPPPTAAVTPAATPTQTVAAKPTATPAVSKEPVKIGVISAWSGPMSTSGILGDQLIAAVEREVKERGGILGDRPLEIVRGDDQGTVAGAAAIATKLVREDNVSVLVWGGVSAPEMNTVAKAAEELGVLFVSIGAILGVEETGFTVIASPNEWEYSRSMERTLMEQLHVGTVAFLYSQDYEIKLQADRIRQTTESAGIKTVYYGLVPLDVMDMSPYLTRIKYEDPDAVLMCLTIGQSMAAAKQMMELGGWGDIQVLSMAAAVQAKNMPGALGWIIQVLWGPGWNNPVSVKFEEAYRAANNGKTPTSIHMYYYFPLWTAIHAIELAGTGEDREAIARAARSGNLKWESPIGTVHFTPDGNSDLKFVPMRVEEGGKLAPLNQ